MATFRAAGPLRLMCASLLTLPYLLFVLTLYPAAATAQIIDCYYFNGTVAPNNTKCPGSNTCCGPKVACFSNRLCADPDPKAKLVRGPCAVKGWDDSCPQICMYNEQKRFPRVGACADGSFCCDDNPNCCESGKGVFLDENGNQVSTRVTTASTTTYPPTAGGASRYTLTPSTSPGDSTRTTGTAGTSSGTSSDSASAASGTSQVDHTTDSAQPSATTTSPDSATATATSAITPSAAPASTSGDSTGLKFGLGLGIPLAVLVTACAVYFFLRRRFLSTHGQGGRPSHYHEMDATPPAVQSPSSGYSPSPGPYGGMHESPPVYRDSRPVIEIGDQMTAEMDTLSPKYDHVGQHGLGQRGQDMQHPRYELH